jgi:hypothetical protein
VVCPTALHSLSRTQRLPVSILQLNLRGFLWLRNDSSAEWRLAYAVLTGRALLWLEPPSAQWRCAYLANADVHLSPQTPGCFELSLARGVLYVRCRSAAAATVWTQNLTSAAVNETDNALLVSAEYMIADFTESSIAAAVVAESMGGELSRGSGAYQLLPPPPRHKTDVRTALLPPEGSVRDAVLGRRSSAARPQVLDRSSTTDSSASRLAARLMGLKFQPDAFQQPSFAQILNFTASTSSDAAQVRSALTPLAAEAIRLSGASVHFLRRATERSDAHCITYAAVCKAHVSAAGALNDSGGVARGPVSISSLAAAQAASAQAGMATLLLHSNANGSMRVARHVTGSRVASASFSADSGGPQSSRQSFAESSVGAPTQPPGYYGLSTTAVLRGGPAAASFRLNVGPYAVPPPIAVAAPAVPRRVPSSVSESSAMPDPLIPRLVEGGVGYQVAAVSNPRAVPAGNRTDTPADPQRLGVDGTTIARRPVRADSATSSGGTPSVSESLSESKWGAVISPARTIIVPAVRRNPAALRYGSSYSSSLSSSLQTSTLQQLQPQKASAQKPP